MINRVYMDAILTVHELFYVGNDEADRLVNELVAKYGRDGVVTVGTCPEFSAYIECAQQIDLSRSPAD